jgi:hypothetical protein
MGDSSRLTGPLLPLPFVPLEATRGGVNGPEEINWTCPATPGMEARLTLFRMAARCSAEGAGRTLGEILGDKPPSGIDEGYGMLVRRASEA